MIYAIGDIHGHTEKLARAHDLIEADRAAHGDPAAPVVHLGDYCDRGPDSAGVIQFLIDGIADGRPWIALKGNHDRLLYGFLNDAFWEDPHLAGRLDWFDPRLGGRTTLASYGVHDAADRDRAEVHRAAVSAVPPVHRAFLEGLPLFHETEELIFVHAGIRPGVAMGDQIEQELIWIREGFLDDDRDHGRLVVHGHTALDHPAHEGNRVNLDGGTGYGRPLVPVVFEGRDCWVLTETGRAPLRPE